MYIYKRKLLNIQWEAASFVRCLFVSVIFFFCHQKFLTSVEVHLWSVSASLLAIKHQTCRFSTEALRGRWRRWYLRTAGKKRFSKYNFLFFIRKNTRFFSPPNLWNWMGKEKRLFCEKPSRGKNSCSRRILYVNSSVGVEMAFWTSEKTLKRFTLSCSSHHYNH